MPLMRRFYEYKARTNQSIDSIASELNGMAVAIIGISSDVKSLDLQKALVMINAVDGPQYEIAKAFLEDKEELTFMMVVEMFKNIEYSTQRHRSRNLLY